MKKKIFALLIVVVLLFSSSVYAETINEEVEEKVVKEHSIFEAGENISLKDNVLGSIALAGNIIKASGEIDGLSLIAGNTVTFEGTTEYLIGAANTITVEGTVNKDTFIAGNIIIFEEGAILNRDVVIVGNSVEVSGTFERDVTFIGSTINLDKATFKGNVTVNGTSLNIAETVSIEGTLNHNEDIVKEIDDKAVIGSVTTFKNETVEINITDEIKTQVSSWFQIMIVFVVMLLLMPKLFTKLLKLAKNYKGGDYITLFGKGFISFLLIPIMSFLLMMSMFGTSLGMILIAFYIILIYISLILTGYILGDTLVNKFIKKEIKPIFVGMIGITIIFLLSLVPYAGMLVSVISLFIAFGLIIDLIFKKA